jgi:cytidylate kinase
MDQASREQRLAEILTHLSQHWETRGKTAPEDRSPPDPFTIALSRQAGTQGTAVARELGSRLGWPIYDRELLEQIAHDMKLHTSLLESVDERRVPWMEGVFENLMGVPYVSDSAYARHLIKTILALGAHGECVIVGRGASFILPAATTLRVLLVAPLSDRIATKSRALGIGRQEAEHRVETVDRERRQFIRGVFAKNLDLTDNVLYDLVLNVSRFSVAACAQVIIEALRQQQISGAVKGKVPTP